MSEMYISDPSVHASEKKRKITLRYFDTANYVHISPDVSG